MATGRAGDLERRAELAAVAEGMRVDEEHVGPEGLRGRRQQLLPEDVDADEGTVGRARSGKLEDADAVWEAEADDLVGARDEEDRRVVCPRGQHARDAQGAAGSPEPGAMV